MKYRRTKTAILTCLIISSIVLSVKVWFNEELWPGGYNFFIMLRNAPVISRIFSSDETYSMPKENLSKPQKIVITNKADRSVIYNSDASFDGVYEIVKDFLTATLSDQSSVINSSDAPDDEWYNVLRNDELLDTRSIYLDFSLAYTPELFAHISGIQSSWLGSDISAVKEFIIAPVNGDGVDVLLYVKDYNTGAVKKYFVSYGQRDLINKAVTKYTVQGENTNSFSFELNLNEKTGGIGSGVVQKVLLDSMVIVSTNTGEQPVIESTNPLSGGSFASRDMLGVFKYPGSSPRHYTDSAGTEFFVENYSVLKIYPEGVVEYTADKDSMGIEISDKPLSLYETLNRAIEFSEKVWNAVVGDMPFNVLVTSNLNEASENGEYNFTLDYYYYGNPVTVEVLGGAAGDMRHAVEICVKNGKIVSYRHFFRKYSPTDTMSPTPSMIESLDSIYENFHDSDTEITISDVYLSYIENGNVSAKLPVWSAKIKGSENVFYLKGE